MNRLVLHSLTHSLELLRNTHNISCLSRKFLLTQNLFVNCLARFGLSVIKGENGQLNIFCAAPANTSSVFHFKARYLFSRFYLASSSVN